MGCPNHVRGPVVYISSIFVTTSAIVPSLSTQPPLMSGKSTAQFAHFLSLRNRIGHQKLSTLRSISEPSDHTPVIQSQYRHQIRSCPTSPLNFCRETFTQSALRYFGRSISQVIGG